MNDPVLHRAGVRVHTAALGLSAARTWAEEFPERSDGLADVELRGDMFDEALLEYVEAYNKVRGIE